MSGVTFGIRRRIVIGRRRELAGIARNPPLAVVAVRPREDHSIPPRAAFSFVRPVDGPLGRGGVNGSLVEARIDDVIEAAQAVVDLSRPGYPDEFWYGVREREMRKLIAALSLLDEAERNA